MKADIVLICITFLYILDGQFSNCSQIETEKGNI